MSCPATDEERPAGYRDLFALVEYRAVFAASVLSWAGDYLCKAAVALLVFDRTGSAFASAAAFAVGYLPWLTAGPLLAAVAERYPSRSVMISCDLARAALIGLIAIPGMPIPVMLMLLFAGGLLAPPFDSARSAQLPQILTGDRYLLGVSFNNAIFNLAQVAGYASGGVIAGYSAHAALLLNAVTFVGSAFLLHRYVKPRPATLAIAHRTSLWREARQGYTIVFGHPLMRAIAFISFGAVTFVIVPEGLAAAWASELGGGGATQGLIMAANPLGVAIGGLILTRLLRPRTRIRLIRPLAVLAPLTLASALLDPPLAGVLILVTASGVVMSLLLPAAQGLFQQVLPNEYRARAYGVMGSGVQIAQGAAILVTGALSERFSISTVIGAWCAAGVLLMLLVTFRPIARPETPAFTPVPAEETP
ncbi:MFS transporter [Actinoallomurus purpureus]|uniref:MFS transporter n=1 Tax=Actinoallomurus purpureus TaxID=478114 RepID=UPI002093589C|nr:MFS transporter [Actinoallomurus purpureus]MCO6005081.1 MFS transporter [Actinoallomurus purpureus]